MQKNERIILSICSVAILFCTSLLLSKSFEKKNSIQTSSNISLDNSKIEWGIKRNSNHEQPELIKRMIDEGHIVGNQSPHALMEL